MPTYVQCSAAAHSMLDRYSHQTRLVRTYVTRVSFRRHEKSTIQRTKAEKDKRHKDLTDYREKKLKHLNMAHKVIWNEALKLPTNLSRKAAYWYRYLIHTDCKRGRERNENDWNVYLSMRVRQMNDGTCCGLSTTLIFTDTSFSATTWYSSEDICPAVTTYIAGVEGHVSCGKN